MNSIQTVLERARREGQIEPDLLPWDGSALEAEALRVLKKGTTTAAVAEDFRLPDDVCRDVDRIIGNLWSVPKAASLRVVGVSSSQPGEGVSTLAALLSVRVTSAPIVAHLPEVPAPGSGHRYQHDHEVLLVDTVWRRPSLHTMFGVRLENGLCDVLANEIPLHAALKKVPSLNLRVLTAGKRRDARMRSLEFARFPALVDQLRQRFTYVFLDIAPVLDQPEGTALSKLCDALILVVRAGSTRREVVEEAGRRLEQADVNLLGAVLNRRRFYIPKWIYRML